MPMSTIQCNKCMSTYIEDEDNLITNCLDCKTDNFMMEIAK